MTWKRPTRDERQKHLRKVARAALRSMTMTQYGAIEGKRPLGTSDVAGDVLEVIGMKPAGEEGGWPVFTAEQEAYAWEIWDAWPRWASRILGPQSGRAGGV